MKRLLTLMSIVLFSGIVKILASDILIEGIWYDLNHDNKTAIVTCKLDDGEFWSEKSISYSGDIVIPDTISYNNCKYSVIGIGFRAFYKCTNLKSVILPPNLNYIDGLGFAYCESLTSVVLPPRLEFIYRQAFANCETLTSIIIPESVKFIGYGVFEGCINLEKVSIGNNITNIDNMGSGIFHGCVKMEKPIYNNHIFFFLPESFVGEYQIPDGIKIIANEAFMNCRKMTSINIPSSVTIIGNRAFTGCERISKIDIPDKVEIIGKSAFKYCCDIETVKIGKSVREIGVEAFYGCKRIVDIYCYPQRVPDVYMNSFSGVNRQAFLWVPSNKSRNYHMNEVFSSFVMKQM